MNKTPGTVLFISHEASRTGAPMLLLQFLKWFRENSSIPFRILIGQHGSLAADFKAIAPVDFFEPDPTIAYRLLRKARLNSGAKLKHRSRLQKLISGYDVKLIYSNTIANGKILDFLSFVNCPVISHIHEMESLILHFGLENIRSVQKHTSRYIAVSEAVRANLVKRHGLEPERIEMIHGFVQPGADLSDNLNRSAVCEELQIPASAKIVCACGALVPLKGYDLFLQVAEKVSALAEGTPVHFVWVGGYPEMIRIVKKRITEGLRKKVHFVGSKVNVIPFYDASDVFLLPSREDSFPLVMMEAALRGKPIVCFADSGGAAEFVEHDAGLIVPSFDVNLMAQRVIELLKSPDLSRRMGENGKNKVLTRHTMHTGAAKIAKIIEDELMGSKYQRQELMVQPEHTL